jgi:hypothetical protein
LYGITFVSGHDLGGAVTVTVTVGGIGVTLTVTVCVTAANVIGLLGGVAVTLIVYGLAVAVVEPATEIGLVGGTTFPLPVVDAVVS